MKNTPRSILRLLYASAEIAELLEWSDTPDAVGRDGVPGAAQSLAILQARLLGQFVPIPAAPKPTRKASK